MKPPKKIVVVGATSDVAQALVRKYAAVGAELCLVGRHPGHLDTLAKDALVRGAAACSTVALDLVHYADHENAVEAVWRNLKDVDLCVMAHGLLGNAAEAAADFAAAKSVIDVNFVSHVAWLTVMVPRLRAQGHPAKVVVLTSVAGDRGRKSNFVYGSAKGALSIYLQGLRATLHGSGIDVVTVKPGPMLTKMTAAMRPGALWISAERAADLLYRACEQGWGEIYLPGVWRAIMLIVRTIPERIFVRLGKVPPAPAAKPVVQAPLRRVK